MDLIGWICFVGLLLLGGLLVLPALFLPTAKRLRSWLNGSRITYYQQYRGYGLNIDSTSSKLRTKAQRKWAGSICDGSVIEINRGLFRRQSAIYNHDVTHDGIWVPFGIPHHWSIAKDWPIENVDQVSLTDTRGLPIETALRMINTYPSLQAMLDRITELESDLGEARERLCFWHSGAQALLEIIRKDKQRYRSPVAQKIRHCLEGLTAELTIWPSKWKKPAPSIDPHKMYDYTKKFEESFGR